MKRSYLIPLLFGVFGTYLQAGDITEIVKSGSMWQMDRNTLLDNGFQGVRYARVDDVTIRVPRRGGLQLADLDFGETLVTWNEEGSLASLVIMIYNKGDDGSIDRESYQRMLSETISALDVMTGVKGKSRKGSQRESGVALRTWTWEWDGGVMRLDASFTGKKKDFEAEFIRLKLGVDKKSVSGGGAADATTRRDLKVNVKSDEESGDVWIEGVNMVDQGGKGYCVPATVARIFAYYGMDGVDQHALAQLCNSSGASGTSPQVMQTALEDISRKFHIRVIPLDGKSATEAITTLIEDYNKAAKKLRKQQASPSNWVGVMTDVDVLREARGNKRYLKKWLAPIKKSVDAGIPVIWSVRLGIFPERGIPQNAGGHMRLIIGYNDKEGTIIYSDSWGAGHEKKTMPAAHAAGMTMSRYILRPSR